LYTPLSLDTSDLHDLFWQVKDSGIPIFEVVHPDEVAIFIFNCSAAYGAMAPDSLITAKMNVGPGGKQPHMWDTIIPLNGPGPLNGGPNTWGLQQKMSYPHNHQDLKLSSKVKGMEMILHEQVGVWDTLNANHAENALTTGQKPSKHSEHKILGACAWCKASEVRKDLVTCIEKETLEGGGPTSGRSQNHQCKTQCYPLSQYRHEGLVLHDASPYSPDRFFR
jgi:hypothetical protein